MHRKLWDFLHRWQGTDSVNEYIRKFNYVQQYGGYPFDTNKKKAELFRNGLSLQLQDRLVMHRDLLFDALVSAVIDQEGLYMGVLAEQEKMRKRALSGPSEESTKGAPPKYRLIYTPSAGKSRVAPPPTQWNHHPPQLQQQQVLPQTPIQSPQPTSPCAPQQKVIIVRAPCFNCRCVGHFARQCPEPKKGKVPRFPTSMVIQQRSKIRAPISRSGCEPKKGKVPQSRIFLKEKKYLWVHSYYLGILSSSFLILEPHITS
jgi:hypothetical protein